MLERIELISGEAAAIREEVFSGEDEAALAAIAGSTVRGRLAGLDLLMFRRRNPAVNQPAARRSFAGCRLLKTPARRSRRPFRKIVLQQGEKTAPIGLSLIQGPDPWTERRDAHIPTMRR